ncbi:MAG: hypothetical protein Q9191_006739 [Dirinaria sp. TL-2023a]
MWTKELNPYHIPSIFSEISLLKVHGCSNFASVVYHTAILQHLTPLLECNYFRPPDQDELRRMMTYHARRGLEILEHSRRLYTTRYQTPLMSFCIVHLGDTIIRHSPQNPPASEVAVFCLEMLSETSAGFAICGPLSALFRQTLTEYGIALPDDLDDRIGSPVEYSLDDILDTCTRLTYVQPTEQILRHLDSSLAIDWGREWQQQVVENASRRRRLSSSGHHMDIGSLLNG